MGRLTWRQARNVACKDSANEVRRVLHHITVRSLRPLEAPKHVTRHRLLVCGYGVSTARVHIVVVPVVCVLQLHGLRSASAMQPLRPGLKGAIVPRRGVERKPGPGMPLGHGTSS
jgi:hypothetical protein